MHHYLRYIFEITKQLSPSEKGYLKKYFNSRSKKESSYADLLIFLDDFKSIQDFEKASGEQLTRYTIIAEDCFNALLSGLEKYCSSSRKEIRKNINSIEILTEKNLPAHADKLIAKSKVLATKDKNQYQFSEISDWEIALLGQKQPSAKNQKEFEKIFESLFRNLSH